MSQLRAVELIKAAAEAISGYTFLTGTRSLNNIETDNIALPIVVLDRPLRINKSVVSGGGINEVYNITIAIFDQTELDYVFEQHEPIIFSADQAANQIIVNLNSFTDYVKAITAVEVTDLINVFDVNLSGVQMTFNIELYPEALQPCPGGTFEPEGLPPFKTFLTDAPADGNQYARQDNEWVVVTGGGGGGAGARWFVGSGAPSNSLGANGDQYLNGVSGDVFSKTSGAWSLTGNIQGPQGPAGSNGTNGTNGTNGRGIVSIEKTSVSGLNDHYTITYTDGTTSEYIVKNGQDGTDGSDGTNGTDGDDGWSPILAVVSDGERRVLQVNDWTGGSGSKPTTGQYVGATGLVNNINQAVDIRGAAGQNATSTVFKSTTNGTSATGTIAQTITYAQLIPANTYTVGDIVRITFRPLKSGTGGSLTGRVQINTTNSLSGALGLVGAGGGAFRYIQLLTHLVIKSPTVTEIAFTNTARITDIVQTSELAVNLNINWAVDQWILFTVQNGSTADTSFGSFFLIEKL